MARVSRSLPAAGLLLALCAAEAFAHHSFSMFDANKTITVSGTVRKFDWTNPHVYIDILVPNEAGQEERWSIESLAVSTLSRRGWTHDTVKPGDKITATIHPMRNGEKGGQLASLTLPGGKVLDLSRTSGGQTGLSDDE